MRLFWVCVFLAVFVPAHSQLIHTFKTLTVNEGLPSNSITGFVEGKLGFMFISTTKGVVRYDGYQMKLIKSDNHLDSGFGVRALTKDRFGMLYGLMGYSGVIRINQEQLTYSLFRFKDLGLPSDTVLSFVFDDNNNCVFSIYNHGLFRLDTKAFRLTKIHSATTPIKRFLPNPKGATRDRFDTLPELFDAVQSLICSPEGVLYGCQFDRGIVVIPPGKAKPYAIRYSSVPGAFQYVQPDEFTSDLFHRLVLQKDTLWIGGFTGVCYIDLKTNRRHSYLWRNMIYGKLRHRDLLPLGGSVFGATDNGFMIFDKHSNDYRLLAADPLSTSAISANQLTKLYRSQDGIIWIGTQDAGVNLYHTGMQRHATINYTHSLNLDLPLKRIRWMYQLDSAQILLISNRFEVYQYHVTNGEWFEWTKALNAVKPANYTNPDLYYIGSAFKLHWFTINGDYLAAIDLAKKKVVFSMYAHEFFNLTGIFQYNANEAFAPSTGTYFFHFPKGDSLYERPELPDRFWYRYTVLDRIDSNRIYFLSHYAKEYVNKRRNNIGEIDLKTNRMFVYDSIKTMMDGEITLGMCHHTNGKIYVSSNQGLYEADPKKGRQGQSGVKKCLDISITSNPITISHQYVCFLSPNGLVRYHPETQRTDVYGLKQQFSPTQGEIAPTLDPDVLFILNDVSVNIVNIKNAFTKPFSVTPRFTEVIVHGDEQFPILSDRIVLECHQRDFTLRFSPMNMYQHGQYSYTYWVGATDTGRRVRLAEPSIEVFDATPQTHHFYVQTYENQKPIGKPIAITIVVQPYWWERWEMRAGFITALLGAAIYAIWHRVNRLRRQQQLLETKVAERTHELQIEKTRSDNLLLNILPADIAEELKFKGKAKAKLYQEVSVLFTDFVGFTATSEELSPEQLIHELNKNFTRFDEIIEQHGLEKIKTIGDAYLAVCGLPTENSNHALQVVQAARVIQQYMLTEGNSIFKVRLGVHSGPVVAGIVGVKKFAYDIWGDTVNTAARMEQNSEPGKINISGATYQLIKEQFVCTYRGEIAAKNKGQLQMYFVERPIDDDVPFSDM